MRYPKRHSSYGYCWHLLLQCCRRSNVYVDARNPNVTCCFADCCCAAFWVSRAGAQQHLRHQLQPMADGCSMRHLGSKSSSVPVVLSLAAATAGCQLSSNRSTCTTAIAAVPKMIINSSATTVMSQAGAVQVAYVGRWHGLGSGPLGCASLANIHNLLPPCQIASAHGDLNLL